MLSAAVNRHAPSANACVTPDHGDDKTISPTSDDTETHFSKPAATDAVSPATADGDQVELNETQALLRYIFEWEES